MKKNYINVLLIVIMFLGSGLIHSQNIITDGDFSSTTEIVNLSSDPQPMNIWSYYLNEWEGISATPTVEDGVCRFEISNLGFNQNFWKIQLIQQGFPLTLGHAYELSFDVKADDFRWFRVFLGEVGGSWNNLIGHDQWHEANEGWQTITIPFEAYAVFPLHKLSFELGNDTTTIYFDNISLIDQGLAEHSIGIIGDAAYGWDDEQEEDMFTTDWVNYTLTDFPLNQGELRFRQDGSWNVNWGGDTFPDGYAIFQLPFNIRVPYSANFNISFNRLTSEYNFECVSENCPLRIGMVGPALNGWDDFMDMQTHNGDDYGVVYYLEDHFFSSGEVKFKQDDSEVIHWGSDDFPMGTAMGTALENGPSIPVEEGHYNVMFNRVTGEYSFELPRIGILGSALIGWNDDIDLQSEDGVVYTINELYLTDGEVKFRLNDDWYVNWGSESFPFGNGYQHGPNIPVSEGTYNVTFNKLSGEYGFVATTCPNPEIICPENIYADNNTGMCGTYVYYPDVLPAPNCGGEGVTVTQTSGFPSGNWFPVGLTTNSFEIKNADGLTATCSFNVFVNDAEPPMIINLNEDYEPLWPPNHQMVEVFIDYEVMDNCPTSTEILISSNEPENGLGDGDHYPDWEVIDEHHVLLRAERSGKGNGREYYITIRVFDSMNFTEEQVIVRVPHNKKKNMRGAVQNEANNNGFVLYPNAADNDIYIKGLSTERKPSYHIYNLYGLLLDHGVLQINKLDISNLPQGMYILRLDTNEGKQSKTFIKN